MNKQTSQGYFCLLATCTRNPKFRTAPFTIPAKEEKKKHITYYSYEAHTGLAKLQNQTGKISVNRWARSPVTHVRKVLLQWSMGSVQSSPEMPVRVPADTDELVVDFIWRVRGNGVVKTQLPRPPASSRPACCGQDRHVDHRPGSSPTPVRPTDFCRRCKTFHDGAGAARKWPHLNFTP